MISYVGPAANSIIQVNQVMPLTKPRYEIQLTRKEKYINRRVVNHQTS